MDNAATSSPDTTTTATATTLPGTHGRSDSIAIILRQTNYDEKTAAEKWDKYQSVESVVREFHGLPIHKGDLPTRNVPSSGINQEIYKQIRAMLPSCDLTVGEDGSVYPSVGGNRVIKG
jgi:hypothetical protein